MTGTLPARAARPDTAVELTPRSAQAGRTSQTSAHAKHYKRMRASLKPLKTLVGRLGHDVERPGTTSQTKPARDGPPAPVRSPECTDKDRRGYCSLI